MEAMLKLHFADPDLYRQLEECTDAEVDEMDFGVIGFDADTIVRRYGAYESRMAGLSKDRVIGMPFFTAVAPCMNNFLVAQRFEDAAAGASPLDAVIDYVLTLRMRPVKVKLRLLVEPHRSIRYVLVNRAA
jgi:photoactive yellow protein